MAILVDKDIERAVDGRLTPTAARVTRVAPVGAPAAAPAAARPRPPAVRFSPMLEDTPPAARRRRRILVGVSVGAHILLFAVLMLMPRRAQTIDEPSLPIEIVLTSPLPAVPEMTRPPIPPKPVEKPKPKPRPEAEEEPPPPVAEAPKPLPKPAVKDIEPAAPVAKAEPPRPKPEVRMGLLDDAPSGPAIVASKTSRSVVVASGFEGSAGTASSAPRPGRVMEAAFDAAPAGGKRARAAEGSVRQSGFGEEAAPAPKKRERERPPSALDSEVEIVSKPKPVYTEEARALKLEGDVVLDVTFTAAGRVVVLGVAQGLGHGLDEAAADAARKIQFNPARRDGNPVDHTAKLRVVFRLA
jgi:TonB family protein